MTNSVKKRKSWAQIRESWLKRKPSEKEIQIIRISGGAVSSESTKRQDQDGTASKTKHEASLESLNKVSCSRPQQDIDEHINKAFTDSEESSSENGLQSSLPTNRTGNLHAPFSKLSSNKMNLREKRDIIQLEKLPKFSPLDSSYNGFPCSRLTLLDRNQRSAFMHELERIKQGSPFEEQYYFKWNVWKDKESTSATNKSYLTISKIIETSSDLHSFIKNDFAKHIRPQRHRCDNTHQRIFLFRFGLYPIRAELPNGFTIELKLDQAIEFEFFKRVAEVILSNRLYSSCELIELAVCGTSLRKYLNHSILTLWIHPSESYVGLHGTQSVIHQQVIKIIEILRTLLSEEYAQYLRRVILIPNDRSQTTLIEIE